MGNTSCDMDSVVGAITLAYYYTRKLGEKFVPVINCKKDELRYRLEIAMHMQDCEISPEHLFFYDTFLLGTTWFEYQYFMPLLSFLMFSKSMGSVCGSYW